MTSDALVSPCGTYRYWLTRTWGDGSRVAGFVMLNPSTADATVDDPTVRRCVGFARSWGCDGIRVVNLFALRATDPKALRGHADPVGPDNAHHLRAAAVRCELLVAAWGAHGSLNGQDRTAVKLIRAARSAEHPLFALGWTLKGHPRHPLYLPATAALVAFPGGPS